LAIEANLREMKPQGAGELSGRANPRCKAPLMPAGFHAAVEAWITPGSRSPRWDASWASRMNSLPRRSELGGRIQLTQIPRSAQGQGFETNGLAPVSSDTAPTRDDPKCCKRPETGKGKIRRPSPCKRVRSHQD